MSTIINHPTAIEFKVCINTSAKPETMTREELRYCAEHAWYIKLEHRAEAARCLRAGIPVIVTGVYKGRNIGSWILKGFYTFAPENQPERGIQELTELILGEEVTTTPREISMKRAIRRHYTISYGVDLYVR